MFLPHATGYRYSGEEYRFDHGGACTGKCVQTFEFHHPSTKHEQCTGLLVVFTVDRFHFCLGNGWGIVPPIRPFSRAPYSQLGSFTFWFARVP